MLKNIVIIVDPFSSSVLIAPELEKRNIKCFGVLSSTNIPEKITKSYTGEGFFDNKLYSSDEIKKIISPESIIAIIPGAETGVYCAEKLSADYEIDRNNYFTSDWRRKKSAMQEQLSKAGMKSISTRIIDQENNNIEDLDYSSGYVIKPEDSCLTDGVIFVDSKEDAVEWISKIDWCANNIMGTPNKFYLVQEKINGDEFVVDLVVGRKGTKVCTLCKYKKGLHNGSHFVYESLDVLNIKDQNYSYLIEYAVSSAKVLGVEFGLAHMEIMDTKDGPTLIELGARLHGGIAPLVFEKCYTPGLLKSLVDLLSQGFDTEPSILISKARIVFLINESKFHKVHDTASLYNELKSVDGVEHVKLFIGNNETMPLTIDLSNCPGIVSLVANTDNELDQAEDKIRSIFRKKEH